MRPSKKVSPNRHYMLVALTRSHGMTSNTDIARAVEKLGQRSYARPEFYRWERDVTASTFVPEFTVTKSSTRGKICLQFAHDSNFRSLSVSISPKLIPVLWFAVAVVVLSGIGLGVGITLLLSKVSHRQVALPLVWTSAALLIAAVTALLVILIHA